MGLVGSSEMQFLQERRNKYFFLSFSYHFDEEELKSQLPSVIILICFDFFLWGTVMKPWIFKK